MATSLSKLIAEAKSAQDKILTPRIAEWLADSGGEVVLSPPVAERIAGLLTQVPRHRSGSFSPSSAGMCHRRQVLSYLGVPVANPPDWRGMAIFADGRFRHLRWQAIGLQEGWFTDIEVPVAVPTLRSKGSMDGENEPEGWLFELKGTSAPINTITHRARLLIDGQGPADPEDLVGKWFLQIHRYMLQSGYRRAVLLVEHKATQEWVEVDIDEIPAVAAQVNDEITKLNDYIEDERLPEMRSDCAMQAGPIFMDCPYRSVCAQATYRRKKLKAVKIT